MRIVVDQPWWLAACLLTLPAGVIAWRWFSAMGRVRRASAVVLRVVLIALLSGMLAGVSTARRTDTLAVIAVVDLSGSVREFVSPVPTPDGRLRGAVEQVRAWLEAAGEKRRPDDLLGLVVFDGSSMAVAAPTVGDPLARSLEKAPVEGTDIAAALDLARALAPPDARARILLISDGVQTAGDAMRSVQGLGPGLPVDVLPLRYDIAREVMVESVDAPPTASAEAVVRVRVTLSATAPARGLVRLFREAEEADINGEAPGTARRVNLNAGLNIITADVVLPPGRVHRFEAVFEPTSEDGQPQGDTLLANNRAEALTLTPGQGSVLILDGVSEGQPGPGATLGRTLERAGINVSTVAPGAMPDSIVALQPYDLIILQNVPAEALSLQQHDLLSSHVRDLGGGLVMIGGPDSFGAGGWKGTALEPILPVRLDLPEQAVASEAAVVFVIDNSGSMLASSFGSSRTKLAIAREATALAIQALDPSDELGVIAFNNDYDVVIPLAPNSDARRSMARVLGLNAGGGTNMGPALRAAARQLETSRAKIRHVIVLSDGRSMNANGLPGIAAELNAAGITLTCIGVGEDADLDTMQSMADRGKGDFHHALNPNMLPRIFVKAVRVIRRPLIREQPFVPELKGLASPITRGLGSPPVLGGLVLTQERTEPTVLTPIRAPGGEPVLAHWNVELGQVAAFTSDASGQWSAAWIDWPGYTRLWVNLARFIARPDSTGRFEIEARAEGPRAVFRLRAAAESGTPLDLLDVDGSMYAPDGSVTPVTLVQVEPGVYEGRADAPQPGVHVLVLKPRQGESLLAPVVGGFTVPRGGETRVLRSNEGFLRELARASNGRELSLDAPLARVLFERGGLPPRSAVEPLWRALLVWTLLVLLLDIGTRRIAWDRWLDPARRAEIRQRAGTIRLKRAPRTIPAISGTTPDPEEIARAELERRREASLEAIRARRQAASRATADQPTGATDADPVPGAPAGPGADAEGSRGEPGPQGPETPDEAGLLAAKRRAKKRFEDDGAL
ncbi:MAG: VWA domain-containing protein [Phycisphaerales bacterium]|nr:VWA domain-containing protein [Phycisphaerales bacterium]